MGCKVLVLGVWWFLLLMYFLLLVFGNIVLVEEHDFKIRSAARNSVVVESYADQKDRGVEEDHWDHHMSPYHPAAKAVDINYMSKRRVPNGADPIHNRRAGKYGQPPSKT